MPTAHALRITRDRLPDAFPISQYSSREEAENSESAFGGDDGGSGGRAGRVEGGFAQLFNRVIDCGHWAALPEAARACYIVLVRFADPRKNFRVAIGTQAMIKHTGLSRSTVKRGLKALQEARLAVVVRAGGVDGDGNNRSNIYQLINPEKEDQPTANVAASTPKKTSRKTSKTLSKAKSKPADPGSPVNPPLPISEPGAVPRMDPAPVQPRVEPRSIGDTQYKASPKTSLTGRASSVGCAGEMAEAAVVERLAASLARWGFEPGEAWMLAETSDPVQISRALEDARRLHRGNRLHSPTGFLRWAIAQPSVELDPVSALAPTPAPAPAPLARRAPESQPTVPQSFDDDEDPVAGLPPEVQAELVDEVMALHAGNPSMLRLLTASREGPSRLLRAEMARLLRDRGQSPLA